MPTNDWLDKTLYPFEPHEYDLAAGTMRYVDEGSGEPLVMVHGTPTWSFLYRHFISGLSPDYRVIAPDHIGSGLSDKPQDFDYRPENHAANLEALITALDLKDITLVLHDFGGPIGLNYALKHPQNVRRLVLFNTWMWPLEGGTFTLSAPLLGGPIGRFLYQRTDFEFSVIVPSVYADRSRLTPEIEAHYRGPFDSYVAWTYARALGGARDFYASLWDQRITLADHPMLLLWGKQDRIFGPGLERFREVFNQKTTIIFDDAGHFVQEEAPEAALGHLREFLAKT